MTQINSRQVDFLLVGGGLASATAAETLRLEGATGTIVIVSAEDRLPYHRPPLSGRLKDARGPGEPPPVLREQEYREQRIEVLRGVRALGLDAAQRVVHTDSAGSLAYGKLLVATGAAPLRLDVPGAGLPGLHYLRTAEDARAIHQAALRGRRCVVVGAGFVGMEVASALRQRGLAVTLVPGAGGIFAPLRDAAIARFFRTLLARHGVEVRDGEVAGFDGRRSVRGVLLADGSRLPCDFAVVGIGVEADVQWLEGSGVALEDGVLVDRHLQASVPDVYAAGDAACFIEPVSGLRRRIAHWDNARRQGRLAARNMLGQRLPYDEVSGFYCQVFDLNFQFIGQPEGAPERATLGSRKQRSWARLYLDDSVPRGLFTTGRPARETATVEALIRYRTRLERLRPLFARPDFVLKDVPSQTVLVLQGGGALGAFECGVVQGLERRGVHPDIVAGVSIGAFNGAIVASHPRHAGEALASFWRDLATAMPALPDPGMQALWNSASALLFGVPGFFTPRWWQPWSGLAGGLAPWTSLYDPAPARRLLQQYVDFDRLRTSPVRLLMTAVDVETAQLEIFDSHVDVLTVDHVLASGSLPPGLPWTDVGGRHFWDGGIVSNSPLEAVMERCGAAGKRVIVVDLFPHARPLPANLAEVLARRDEIVYAERVRRTAGEQALLQDARQLVEGILAVVDEATGARIRELPTYVQLIGAPEPPTITRIVREPPAGPSPGRDFDFSQVAVDAEIAAGLAAVQRVLGAHTP